MPTEGKCLKVMDFETGVGLEWMVIVWVAVCASEVRQDRVGRDMVSGVRCLTVQERLQAAGCSESGGWGGIGWAWRFSRHVGLTNELPHPHRLG